MQTLNLVVDDTAVDFYTAVLGGRETMRECLLDSHVLCAEIVIGDYRLHVTGRTGSSTARPPTDVNTLFCPDPERLAAQCAAAGAFIEPGRSTIMRDRDGYRWALRMAADSTV